MTAEQTADTGVPALAAWGALVQSLPEPTWVVCALSLRVVAANSAAQRLLGREQLVGAMADSLLATPEDAAYWCEVAAGGAGTLESDTTLCAASGRSVHVVRSIRPVRACADGTTSGATTLPTHYTVVLSDRTQQRLADGAREQALSELQATLEATADGILVTDLHGHIRAFNRRFADIFALPQTLLLPGQHEAMHDWLRLSVADVADGGADSADGNGGNGGNGSANYTQRLNALCSSTAAQPSDRLQLRSGQLIERVVRPLWQRGQPMGHVFSFRDLSERVAADRRIEELSQTDALTGLPNRGQLAEGVARASQALGADTFALLLVDLDRFRAINDTLGTATADKVLCDVTQRLRGCLRQGDLVARVGGDQFAMLVHHAGVPAAEAAARRVLDAVSQPSLVDGAQFTLTCSIGVALFPAHGRGVDDLLRHAETAVRSVKDAGRGSFRVHTLRREVDRRAQLKLDHAMRLALANNGFRLHYQPQVCMASGAVVGAEALLRWQHAELGNVAPAQFIPVAEESGFIIALGDWVMNQAVRQAAQWAERGHAVPVAVNVSALQFQQPGFVDRVAGVLAANGLDARWLELELTESILVRDADDTLNRLNALARIGVRLSIDDFGTGYSSLSYLKRFPIGKLKIDRSFVQGLPADDSDAGIVRAILQMAQALGLKVIAEGVETEGQRRFLQDAGCAEYQGYLFAPALESTRFEERLVADQVPVWMPSQTPAQTPAQASAQARRLRPAARHIRLVHG